MMDLTKLMKIGTARIDITPPVGVELTGFVARVQPSVGVHDPLFLRTLYLESGDQKLLWLHGDLLGWQQPLVGRVQEWARQQLGLNDSQLILSATHTHSGPAIARLIRCGEVDEAYLQRLFDSCCEAARQATRQAEPVKLLRAEGRCELAIDRRNKPSAHTDPRVGFLAWQREDKSLAAVLANYPMHAVAMGAGNRLISGDWPGMAAATLEQSLPGNPLVMVTNGPAGNLNPSKRDNAQMVQQMAGQLASVVEAAMGRLEPTPSQELQTASVHVPLPLDAMDADGVDRTAKQLTDAMAGRTGYTPDRVREAFVIWRDRMLTRLRAGTAPKTTDLFLQAIRLGDVNLLTINAEAFSILADELRRRTGQRVYVVGYANHLFGYLPAAAAYAEGGYEVDSAHLFYDHFRVGQGGLELATERGAELIHSLAAGASSPMGRGAP